MRAAQSLVLCTVLLTSACGSDSTGLVSDGGGDSGGLNLCSRGGVCGQIHDEYTAAVQRERICTPGAASQCLERVETSLACGCEVWVNSTLLTDAARKRWVDAGCERCLEDIPCTAIACAKPVEGVCAPAVGQCTERQLTY